jgi:hypothetical protein
VRPAGAPAAKRKGGRKEKSLEDYIDEFQWLNVSAKKKRVTVDGEPVDVNQLRCSHCSADWSVTKEKTINILSAIQRHEATQGHKSAMSALALNDGIRIVTIRIYSNSAYF